MSAEPTRTWIVTLICRAAFRFDANQRINVRATPQTTVPLIAVRLRNQNCWATADHSEGASQFIGGFVVEAAGDYATADAAVGTLANLVAPYLQVMSLIANAGIEDPEDMFVYAIPEGERAGAFVVQRHTQARAPAARTRKVAAVDAVTVLEPLGGHPQEATLHRAMSHYRAALGHLDPLNRVLSAQSLWMAVEALTHVVLFRLRAEHGMPQNAKGKHLLALKLGFNPKTLEQRSLPVRAFIRAGWLDPSELARDHSHLVALDRHIRLEILLGNDRECYKQLSDMSNGYEHGYMPFDQVQTMSKVADRAFTYLRRAMLREIRLGANSPLFDERYDDPLGVWRPIFEGSGRYTDLAAADKPVTAEHFMGEWPDPPGINLVPGVKAVVDRPDGVRDITYEVNGSMAGLTATQTVHVEQTRWLSPCGRDGKLLSSEMTEKVNGEVVNFTAEIAPSVPFQDRT